MLDCLFAAVYQPVSLLFSAECELRNGSPHSLEHGWDPLEDDRVPLDDL